MEQQIHKIIRLWFPKESYGYNEAAYHIIKLICEEIEKVENPQTLESMIGNYSVGFETCRYKILNLLHPKENVVGTAEL